MDPFDDVSQPESLLSHSDFLHSLAQGLLSGVAGADDLVQETWITALERPPKQGGNLGGWLRRVATNHAIDRRRSEARRIVRETIASQPEGLPSPAEVVEREELRTVVVQALLALAPPYRSALLLSYYEGLPPRLVAKRLRIPVETARTRIKRGLAKLRAELDLRYGGRAAWGKFLLPFARPGGGEAIAALDSGSMAARPAWFGPRLLVGFLLVGLTTLWIFGPSGSRRSLVGLLDALPDADAAGPSEAAPTSSVEARDRFAVGNAFTPLEVRLVREEDREPVAGAQVKFQHLSGPESTAVSDKDGIVLLRAAAAGRAELFITETPRSLARMGGRDRPRTRSPPCRANCVGRGRGARCQSGAWDRARSRSPSLRAGRGSCLRGARTSAERR